MTRPPDPFPGPPSGAPAGSLPRLAWLALAVVALTGVACALYTTSRHGVGASTDSSGYVAAAESLAAGEGFKGIDGAPFLLQPPAYPALLALAPLTGLDTQVAARYLAALLYGAILLLAGIWLLRHLRSRAVAALGLLTLLATPPLLRIGAMAWSEALFILLATASLFPAARYLATGRAGSLAATAALAALACLTRYAGAPLVAMGALLALARPGHPWSRRLGHAAAFAAGALLPTVLWLARNWAVAHTFLGERRAGGGDPVQVAAGAVRELRQWYVPLDVHAGWLIVSPLAGALAAALVGAALLWPAGPGREERGRGPEAAPLVPVLAFAALYAVFIVAVKTVIGQLEDRYVYPLLVPFVLMLAWTMDRALARADARLPRPRAFRAAVLVAAGLWLAAYPVPRAVAVLSFLHADGMPNFGTNFWQGQQIARALARRAPDGFVYSNAPGLFYWLTRHTVEAPPRRQDLAGPPGAKDFTRPLERRAAAGTVTYLVWFAAWAPTDQAGPAELARLATVVPLWSAADGSGTVYRIVPPAAAGP